MSDVGVTRGGERDARLIAPVTVALLLVVGIACFVATLLLGAYAPDLRGGGNGGGHALSDAVNGYSGIVRLAAATGRNPRIVRNTHALATEDLVVATPEQGAVSVDPVLGPRGGRPTLLVLPKYATAADPDHRGWATVAGLLPVSTPQGVLSPAAMLAIMQYKSGGRPLRTIEPTMTGVAFRSPKPLQVIYSSPLRAEYGALLPLVVDDHGAIVLGKFANRPLFVLADPDLLDNRGMHDAATARAALAMLDWMNSNQAEGIAFDVTLNGFGHGASPLKLLFAPPFLATTLAIAATILLAALGTLARFGSARPRERAIAFGKAALVDNTAALVAKARREARLGGRYVEVVREAAVRAFGVPARLRGPTLDAYLDRLGRRGRFTELAAAVTQADTKDELVAAARALHDWMGRDKT